MGKRASSKLDSRFDIALAAVDLANEINEAYEAVQSFDDYTSKIPKDSLEATKALGDLYKKEIHDAQACERSSTGLVNQTAN